MKHISLFCKGGRAAALALVALLSLSAVGCSSRLVSGDSQNTYRPRNYDEPDSGIPTIAQPLDTICHGGIPDGRLGLSLQQLIGRFPQGLYLVGDNGERMVYKHSSGVIFEMLNNHVAVVRQEVDAHLPFGEDGWYRRVVRQADASAYKRVERDGTWVRYSYPDFTFSITYDNSKHRYQLRFDYLPSHYPYSSNYAE